MDQTTEPDRAQSWIKKDTSQVLDPGTTTRTGNGSAAPVSVTSLDSTVSKRPTSPEPLINVVARTEVVTRTEQAAAREFVPVPLAERTSIGTSIVSNENVWPVLPPSPKFDVADELAAKEQEAEALRRLEQEQRGTLWNA
jgi:hypothetical protein